MYHKHHHLQASGWTAHQRVTGHISKIISWGFQPTITFCCVGFHHINAIVERNIKTLTVGARTLILYAKIFLPKSITTMLWIYRLKAFSENCIHSIWMMMWLLLWRIFQAQQHTLVLKLSHIGLFSLCLGWSIERKHRCTTQLSTPIPCRDLSWSLTISCRISSSGSKPIKWSCITSI